MKNSELILHTFLVESQYLDESEFLNLTEESKMETLKDIASTVMKSLKEKIAKIDTALIDRSKGDIKAFRDFEAITNSLTNLETMVDRSSSEANPELVREIKLIAKAILYLNQYSNQFKDAYRNKKTLMVMKYQSIVLSIISATAYLVSVMVDFSKGAVSLNMNPKFDIIAPIRTLDTFVNSIESGEFRIELRDVQAMRESFDENKVGESLTEASTSMLDTIVTGLRNLYSSLDKNSGKLAPILYKVAGVVALIFSLRDTFYSVGNMKLKVMDMLDGLKQFGNVGEITSGLLNKLNKFTAQCKVESEFGTEMADREMKSEDRSVATSVSPVILKKPDVEEVPPTSPAEISSLWNF